MGMFSKFKKKKSVVDDMYFYSAEEIEEFESFIQQEFGDYNEVFHEIVSPDIHVDIIIVPPTKENNYYKLITMGMGAYSMKVPEELKSYELERAELIICLPPTWNIKSDKEEDYWPIRQLKRTVRLPIQCDTWLGYGHCISNDYENTPFAKNTDFCSILLLTGLNSNYQSICFKMKNKGTINFYQLFPLYEEELNYKQEHGAETLLKLFDDVDISVVVNINRKNYGKK